jgi:hypothetical protein
LLAGPAGFLRLDGDPRDVYFATGKVADFLRVGDRVAVGEVFEGPKGLRARAVRRLGPRPEFETRRIVYGSYQP